MRVGKECYAKINKSYGVTSMKKSHVKIDSEKMVAKFNFKAKSNKQVQYTLDNSEMVKELMLLMDLEGELNSVKVRIGNNNKIMGRQQDNYEIVNKEYEDINKKTKMFKKTDETSKLNIDLVNNYTAQKSYLLKLYPFIILILGLASIYLTYSTIMKFKINIYDKY